MKNRVKLFLWIFLITVIGVIISCTEEDFWKILSPPNTNPVDIGLNVETLIATKITESSATLNGVLYVSNTLKYPSFMSFEYYTEDSLGRRVYFDTPLVSIDLNHTDPVNVSATIGELSSGTTYYYFFRAWNKLGETPMPSALAFATNPTADKYFQGGIKFYVDSTGQHGLIASTNDLSIGEKWSYIEYPNGTAVNGTGTSIGTGLSNTTAIVSAYPSGTTAARLCDNLVLNGYIDWFLPSKDELNLLYKKRLSIGGFSPDAIYWSSSEISANFAWAQTFDKNYGTQQQIQKDNNNLHVRAIRAY
jgi:hypothetical protein